jgi:hypothetical protein
MRLIELRMRQPEHSLLLNLVTEDRNRTVRETAEPGYGF